jgi:hypothetical protein
MFFCFGKANEVEEKYKNIFWCEVGSLPFKYLGIPVHYRRLLNTIEDSVEASILGKEDALIWRLSSANKFSPI